MTELIAAVIIFILLLLVDLFAVAARTSLLQTTNARILALREEMGESVNRTILLLSNLPRLKASLNQLLVITRFLMAGLVIFMMVFIQTLSYSVIVSGVILLVAAMAVFWLEWLVDTFVWRNPELWALRLTTFARVVMAISTINK